MANDPRAFTYRPEIRLRRIILPCGISKPVNPQDSTSKERIETFNALWDTGATTSCITKKVVDSLGLIPFDVDEVYHAKGKDMTNIYKVNMHLPNGVRFPMLRVMEATLNDCDAIIGMDIIGEGDFVITSRKGQNLVSFQYPSTHEYDFVKQINSGVGSSKKKKKKH